VSHEESHEHAGSSVFTPEECEAMHLADRQAVKSFLLLIISVFTFGLIMYSFISITL
jgi:hypothetical protein